MFVHRTRHDFVSDINSDLGVVRKAQLVVSPFVNGVKYIQRVQALSDDHRANDMEGTNMSKENCSRNYKLNNLENYNLT